MTSALFLAAVATSGCSAIFTKGPPLDHAYNSRFDCSTSYAPPILDTIWAGLNGAGAAIAMSKSDAEWERTQTNDRAATIAVGLTWLAPERLPPPAPPPAAPPPDAGGGPTTDVHG